jgi:ABC-type dipeptide/oligopeptide/nickel transport system permease subunit
MSERPSSPESERTTPQKQTIHIAMPKPRSLWRDALHQFFRNKLSILGIGLVGLFIFTAVFGSYVTPYDPYAQDLARAFEPPSIEHWFGNDELGRDIFSRIVQGTRTAAVVGFSTVAISLAIGIAIGTMAGYLGPKVDAFLMWFTDLVQSIPQLLLAMLVNVTLRQPVIAWIDKLYEKTRYELFSSYNNWWVDFFLVFGALALVSWPGYARLIRGQVLSITTEDYVMAARAVGVTERRIMITHIIPNAIGPLVVASTMALGTAITNEAGLSFLGIGIQPPNASWGSMLSRGLKVWAIAPHVMLIPALAIGILRVTCNFLGDGLNDALNPKYQRGS